MRTWNEPLDPDWAPKAFSDPIEINLSASELGPWSVRAAGAVGIAAPIAVAHRPRGSQIKPRDVAVTLT